MKRRVQAQRKFAQGAPLPPNNANNSERKGEIVPNREEQRNVVRNNTGAKTLLDIISFKQIHIHKTPVVVLERLRTDTINPYAINQRIEQVDEQLETTSVTIDVSNKNICDSTAITSSRNSMSLRSRTRSHKNTDPKDPTMTPNYSEQIESEENLSLRTVIEYEEKEDSNILVCDPKSELHIIPITSTQRSYSCNMSDISLDEDKPLAQYVKRKGLSTTKQHVAIGKKKGNKNLRKTNSIKPTAVPLRRVKKKLTDALKRTQNITYRKKSIISCVEDMLDTGSGSGDEDYTSLTAIKMKSPNYCESSAEDVAVKVPFKKRKYAYDDSDNNDNDVDGDCDTFLQTVQEELDTPATLTRLPKPTECNVIETLEILDDDDNFIILPSDNSEYADTKQRRISQCPIQNMTKFCEIIDAPKEYIKYRCCICSGCVKLDKFIEIRLLVDHSKWAKATTIINLNSIENLSFLDTTRWTDQLTVDLDISKQYNLRVCYCKHVMARDKPILFCTLITKPIKEAPPIKAIEAQYARVVLEYLDKHFCLYSKEQESIHFETENENVCITRNKIAFVDKIIECEENTFNELNTDNGHMKVTGSMRSPVVDNELNNSFELKQTETGNKQCSALYSETVSVNLQESYLDNGDSRQSSSQAIDQTQVTINLEDNDLLREQIDLQFISRLKSFNSRLSTPINEYLDTVTPETQENYDGSTMQNSPILQRYQDDKNQIRIISDIVLRHPQSAVSTTQSANIGGDIQNENSWYSPQLTSNKSSEQSVNEHAHAICVQPKWYWSPTEDSSSEYSDINTSRTGREVTQVSRQIKPNSCNDNLDGTHITASNDNLAPTTSMANTLNNRSRIMISPSLVSTNIDDGGIQNMCEIPKSAVSNEQRHPYSLFNKSQTIKPKNIRELHPNPEQSFLNAPVFEPTAEEFLDPVAFFDSIMPIASKYGICKVIPPKEFAPSCTLNDEMMFNVTNQYVTRLFSRWGPGSREMSTIKAYLASQSVVFKRAPLYEGMEVNLPKLYQIVQRHGGLKKVIERKRWSRVAEEIRFTKGPNPEKKLDQLYVKFLLPYDTLSSNERGQIMSRVERAWCEKYRKMTERAFQPLDRQNKLLAGSDSSEEERSDGSEDDPFITGALLEAEECVMQGRKMNLTTFKRVASNAREAFFPNVVKPSTSTVEEEYWRVVLLGSEHLCVISASIDTGTAGYGFTTNSQDLYGNHPWNLKNMASSKNNILRYLGPVLGVTVPTLHLGMVFSTSCWHRDPHGLPWMEYMHSGPTKIWYGIPDEQSDRFRKAVETLCPTSCQNKTIWLPSDITMIPPNLLREQNVTLSRVEQNPGEFIIIFPKAYSCSISTGYTVSESVYFASKSWLLGGLQFFTEAQISCEPTMISFESLLLSIVTDKQTPLALLQPALSVLNQLLEYERAKRFALEDDLHIYNAQIKHLKHPPGVWNVREQDECEFCRKSLYLSRVRGLTTNNTSVCLEHAIVITDVRTAKKFPTPPFEVHYFFSTDELTSIIKAAETRLCKIT